MHKPEMGCVLFVGMRWMNGFKLRFRSWLQLCCNAKNCGKMYLKRPQLPLQPQYCGRNCDCGSQFKTMDDDDDDDEEEYLGDLFVSLHGEKDN